MRVAAQTIKRHLGGILNYFENRATNAAIESFHSFIREITYLGFTSYTYA